MPSCAASLSWMLSPNGSRCQRQPRQGSLPHAQDGQGPWCDEIHRMAIGDGTACSQRTRGHGQDVSSSPLCNETRLVPDMTGGCGGPTVAIMVWMALGSSTDGVVVEDTTATHKTHAHTRHQRHKPNAWLTPMPVAYSKHLFPTKQVLLEPKTAYERMPGMQTPRLAKRNQQVNAMPMHNPTPQKQPVVQPVVATRCMQ